MCSQVLNDPHEKIKTVVYSFEASPAVASDDLIGEEVGSQKEVKMGVSGLLQIGVVCLELCVNWKERLIMHGLSNELACSKTYVEMGRRSGRWRV